METIEYTVSNQELFFIVAQTVWDTFLLLLLSIIISVPVAYVWALIETNKQSNRGQ